jgi:Fe-S-cluster containining protein
LWGEAQAISKAALKPVETFAVDIEGQEPYVYEMRKTGEEGKCLFLEGRNCGVYALRPLVCVFYPFELKGMKDGKLGFFCTPECPGIGKGKKLEKDYFEGLFRRACQQLDA